jgi:hypothetical protein
MLSFLLVGLNFTLTNETTQAETFSRQERQGREESMQGSGYRRKIEHYRVSAESSIRLSGVDRGQGFKMRSASVACKG